MKTQDQNTHALVLLTQIQGEEIPGHATVSKWYLWPEHYGGDTIWFCGCPDKTTGTIKGMFDGDVPIEAVQKAWTVIHGNGTVEELATEVAS